MVVKMRALFFGQIPLMIAALVLLLLPSVASTRRNGTIVDVSEVPDDLHHDADAEAARVPVDSPHVLMSNSTVCRQNNGRNCSEHEANVTYLVPELTGPVWFPDSKRILSTKAHFAANSFGTPWRFYNPGVAVFGGRIWVVMRCEAQGFFTHMCPDDSLYRARACPRELIARHPYFIFNFVCMAHVDERFRIASPTVYALPHNLRYTALIEALTVTQQEIDSRIMPYGAGDARVFEWDHALYIAFHATPEPRDLVQGLHYNQMYIRQIKPVLSTPVQLRAPGIINGTTWEKNWAPIDIIVNATTGATDYLFSRFIEPHQIMQCSKAGVCTEVASTSHSEFFDDVLTRHQMKHYHLGTNAVRLSDEHYGAIFHVMTPGGKHSRKYHQIPYMFQARYPWSIVAVSRDPLKLPRSVGVPFHYHFASGLAFVDGKLVVSYGCDDERSKFFITSAEHVFGDMHAIGA